MKFLREENVNSMESSTKNVDGEKSYILSGITIQCDIINENGRKYPLKNVQGNIEYYNEMVVKDNRSYGELDHPETPNISLQNVSHRFTNLHREGSNYISELIVADTPNGKKVKNLMDIGSNLGISTRALADVTTDENGVIIVEDNFMLVTPGDIVAEPSAPDAYVESLMEGTSWTWNESAKKFIKEDEIKRIKKLSKEKMLIECQKHWIEFIKGIKLI